jgi:predicted ATPase/class 3 adenylate cyclase
MEVGVRELPTGTVTFLFTDLEGSTRLWEEQPEAMGPASARHDELVRSAIEASSGTVVKTTGDGFHAVFAVASDAVDAAVMAQLALADEPWGATGPLRVRMGVHTGAAELRDDDYYSSAVNRAARLTSIAHGGQIVVSSTTSGLVPDGSVMFVDLGEHRLRDLAEPMQVYQVTHPGLPREFPRIRSLDALPGNLPAQLTSFVGRGDELAGLAQALDEWRLVTLTGTGGVGKSRLAVQLAAEVLPRFRDGAWLCELALADDDETMGQGVATALRVSQRSGMSWTESVCDYLRPMELLLVLDNCEHLIGPTSDLADWILRECPAVRILTTSREGLGVAGEHVWPLRSLPVPDSANSNIAASDAVILFAERAEAARASFTLDASNEGAIAEICRRLDGIPLAIELAAARVVSMTASEISGLLDERFRLLTGGRRKSVERHQTLRATVDWSYSLLTDAERTVFDRLGVFAGRFDAPAARTVIAGDRIEAWDVLDALGELVAKSMVLAEDTAGDTTRYLMLETLGQYARERLDETGETDNWRRRHAEHFARWAEDVGPGLVGPDELVWRTRERAEIDNLRAAVVWALDRPDPAHVELALRIIGALVREVTNNPVAGLGALAERALLHAETTTPQLRYALIAAVAQHQVNLGNYSDAQELARRAIGDGVPPGVLAPACAHTALAISTVMLGDAQGALAIALEAKQLVDHLAPGSPDAAYSQSVYAVFAAAAGDPSARLEAELARRLARAAANPTVLAQAEYAHGYALLADDPAAALVAFDDSIALARQGAQNSLLSAALVEAAGVRARVGDLAHAVRDLREGIERDHQAGTRNSVYVGAWWGIDILIGRDRINQAAVFDGIVSTGLPVEHRAVNISPSVGEPELAHQRAVIAHARTTYGPDRYDAAFRTGAAMSYDQVVEYTLDVLDAVINEAG